MTTRNVLLALGGTMELTGIVLISLDILMPGLRALGGSAQTLQRRLVERVGRLVASIRGDLHTVVQTADFGVFTDQGFVIKRPDADAPVEDQVRELVELQAESQERLYRAEQRLEGVDARITRERLDVRNELLTAIEAAISQTEGAYLRWRSLGFILAVSGASLVLVASIA